VPDWRSATDEANRSAGKFLEREIKTYLGIVALLVEGKALRSMYELATTKS
jgi:hypothetical protein